MSALSDRGDGPSARIAGSVRSLASVVVATAPGGVPTTIQCRGYHRRRLSNPDGPAATSNRMVIAYRDPFTVDDDVPYTSADVIGDGDNLLEPGELKLVVIQVGDITPAPTIAANSGWTLELQTPVGAVVDLRPSMPGELADVMQLH